MFTSANEYYKELYSIQKEHIVDRIVEEDQKIVDINTIDPEKIYELDLNNRTVITTRKFLSVEYDHNAEIIYFKLDRYFDAIDLTTKSCIIQFTNAKNKPGIYLVPYYDIVSLKEENKILIPWMLSGAVTAYSGTVKYAIKFYSIEQKNLEDPDSYYYTFNLNTLPTQGNILHGMQVDDKNIPGFEMKPGDISIINQSITDLRNELKEEIEQGILYWEDVI